MGLQDYINEIKEGLEILATAKPSDELIEIKDSLYSMWSSENMCNVLAYGIVVLSSYCAIKWIYKSIRNPESEISNADRKYID